MKCSGIIWSKSGQEALALPGSPWQAASGSCATRLRRMASKPSSLATIALQQQDDSWCLSCAKTGEASSWPVAGPHHGARSGQLRKAVCPPAADLVEDIRLLVGAFLSSSHRSLPPPICRPQWARVACRGVARGGLIMDVPSQCRKPELLWRPQSGSPTIAFCHFFQKSL